MRGAADGNLNCKIGLKSKQLAEGGAHLCNEGIPFRLDKVFHTK